MNINSFQNWRVEVDAAGIAWATLDRAGESTNALSSTVMNELARLLDQFEHSSPKGLIFRSGKEAGFIAGADIQEFTQLDTPEKGIELVARGWHLFNRLATVSYPTLALVRGHCLGGGLELALACRYLLAVDEPSTRMGLPEVMLGIVPGWGGMLRLPERIGPQAALDMMLTGKTIDAVKAKRLGLADDCVPARVMDSAAALLVLSEQRRRRLPLLQRLLNGPLQGLVARGARRQVGRRARREHYPAPYAIIDIWARHQGNALAAPALINRIVRSPTARNLVRVFFLQERLKNFGKAGSFTVRRLHVVGAGVMGGDIAAWCALRGLTVTLQDQGMERIVPALQRAYAAWSQRIRDKRELRNVMDRLIPDPEGHGARQADVVIEAIFEDLDAKRALLVKLEAVIKTDAVLATNTSSLRIEDLSKVLARPQRLIGLHFFNPVAKMPLIEVVAAAGTDPEMLQRGTAFVKQIDRLPLPVRSAPGFLVNAVLGPYMLEAMRAVDEGFSAETVDEAMLAFGMPMGPIELADMVGLDVAMAAGKGLAGSASGPPKCLLERFNAGHFGKKSGRGFYDYPDGRPAKKPVGTVPAALSARLVKPLLDRTQQLVSDGVVADADLADAGVIFGTGFAPFTGGPMNYVKGQQA
ncbi:3-hydroxyacyl-CoA dehydrogenase NAD-binding domain-containing protein [Candidatus Accumulibacter vicinus]|uniref:Fatty acid oxidation complex subunit alpha n=1 Tax=Candidatus Accumulibacter vicinus TaxID=2954382 RepID=A0A084Y378_9PROT|nr:3-hydroxyacyl-CoA dehydrogenase NAD-binding domain-containing protein [Candidatus Accumulibacter vicinus]KFB69172.1 MAG: Fatty acid oxidation complex subunit alpha [Candidatus Accumulibacter vicinus]